MNILGLIPARGGSKSIPRKNIVPLAGKPLLAYTCEAALDSAMLTRVVLSTDENEIAQVGRDFGVDVPFIRPTSLAQDDTGSVPVAQHAIQWLAEHDNWQTDIVVLLQPTSPLRTAQHINDAVKILLNTGSDTVVSVVEVPHQFSPYKLMTVNDNGLLEDFWQDTVAFNRLRRQDVPALLARNGPAVLVSRAEVVAGGSFYGTKTSPFYMSQRDSLDIDTLFDLQLADCLLGEPR